MTKLDDLAALGQSIWLDYIRRKLLTSGELQALIDVGLRGETANPTIFEKAIAGSPDYTEDLNRLVSEGQSAQEICDSLFVADIQLATDLFRPVYDRTQKTDGYVSLEVNPLLAKNTQQTIDEARRLWSMVDRPNLMVKIPATKEGLPAIAQATADGINVNITLIFSLKRYDEVMAAYLQGLRQRLDAGQPVDHIHSVASFFVSRVDTKVDKQLAAIQAEGGPRAEKAASLLGKAAVANARLAYQKFCQVFTGEAFQSLHTNGANLQRPLWASTSTKNPAYSDLLYVQNLIGEHTVNTLPQETMQAFIDHGEIRPTIEDDLLEAQTVIAQLEELGISMDRVTQELEDEGVAAFTKSFQTLLATIEQQRALALARQPGENYSLHTYQYFVDAALHKMEAEQILPRIWKHDHTVWKPDPTEITNRLGWLTVMDEMRTRLGQLEALRYSVQQAGYTHALLLGMGGSSLAPELFGRVFGTKAGALRLEVLDSTDPAAVLGYAERLDPGTTLYIVSTKSGTTEETLSFFKYFYNQTVQKLGAAKAGDHFIAITDPGSKLVTIAQAYSFRATLINDPDIGGRYSALSYFGLLPAAMGGVDLQRLLDSAVKMARQCAVGVSASQNPAARLGTALGELSKKGRDKATFILSPAIAAFGDWVEQLIAESTGKEGKGLLPVVGEALGDSGVYGPDRLFIDIRLEGDTSSAESLAALEAAGHPVIRMGLGDIYDLGGQFFLWELATAVAGQRLGINPFDQPNVESAKVAARAMAAAYKEAGKLPEQIPLLSIDGISVYLPITMETTLRNPREALQLLLDQAHPGDYISLQAFIPPDPQNAAALQALRQSLRNQTHLATTLGFGPRFLHSTGQLHKGDSGRGLFVQFTYTPSRDTDIPLEAGKPQSAMSFGVLQLSQALGDQQTLVENDRRVIRFHIDGEVPAAITSLWK